MFQFRRFPAYTYFIQCTLLKYCFSGFPHSEIPGSMDICSSPRLIAACHVLLRLLMPRHSPCALSSLTLRTIFFQIWFSVELCRQSQRVWLNCIVYPSPFGVVPQLNFAFFQISLKDLSVALLITLISLFSFQGAISDFLRSEISSQSLKSLFPSLITRIWWARVGSNHRPYDYQSYALASWATGPFGGDSRDRTGDLLLARQALSQLSYIPNYFSRRPMPSKLNNVTSVGLHQLTRMLPAGP